MLSPNSILQNRYRVVRQLGEGGMGTVYEAIDQRVSCVVALKETLVGNDVDSRRAFEREAALLANLRHPALPKVMDYFIENEGEFLVMEFIPGHDLAELLELRGGPFPQDQILQWADDLLKVLEHLHGLHPPILHRDIKPANLKLTKQGEIFLLDFGLAKGSAGQMPTLQTSKSVRGYTPVYSPLEQIHGQGTDARSDLYALGATLYHLSTGRSPIDAPTRFVAVDEDAPDPLRPLHAVNPQVSPAVSEVIRQAMAIRRRGRFSNATAMRRALLNAREQWLESEPQAEGMEAAVRAVELDRNKQLRRAAERREREAVEAEQRRPQLEETRLAQQRLEQEGRIKREAEETRARNEAAARAEAELRQRQAEDEARLTQQRREQQQQASHALQGTRAAIDATEHTDSDAVDLELTQPAVKEREYPSVTQRSPSEAQEPTPTVLSPQTEETESRKAAAQEAQPIRTIRVTHPDKPTPTDSTEAHGTFLDSEIKSVTGTRSNRGLIVLLGAVAAVLVAGIVVVAGFYLWLSKGAQTGSANPQAVTQAPAGKPSNLPHPAAPDGMVYIPGGEFTMGRDDGDEYERPAHQVTVKPFFIDLHELTNQEYQDFVDKTGHVAPEHWASKHFPEGKGRMPVTNVDWDDANAYAQWARKRLPTEAEWEFAGRGTDGRRYPWGDDYKDGLANVGNPQNVGLGIGLDAMTEVGKYNGASPYGLVDMVGNAWEWTADKIAAYPGGHLPEHLKGEQRVIRGGSFASDKNSGITLRRGYPARGAFLYHNTGFRCVKDVN